jgi:tetratricopeptide (TPR) repeat protein
MQKKADGKNGPSKTTTQPSPQAGIEGVVDPEILTRARDARGKGLFPIAKQLLEQQLRITPHSKEVRRELATTLIAAEDFERAVSLLQQDVAADRADHFTFFTLALCHCRQGNAYRELEMLTKALALRFEELSARRMFELQRDANDLEGALATVRALRKLRDTDELQTAEIRLLSRIGREDESVVMSTQLLDRQPLLSGAVEHWASHWLGDKNDPQTVARELEARLQAGREEPLFLALLSRAYHRMDQMDKSVASLKRAVELDPSHQKWWYDLAVQQRQVGDISGSQVSLKRANDLDPLDPVILRIYGAEHRFTYGDPQFKRINQALALTDSLPKPRQIELHYAAAKAYEDVGELDTAFEHYHQGGRKQTELSPYREASASGLMRTLRLGMRPSTYEAIKDPGDLSHKPVFVLGMPRSGTTLAEQIISSHPKAFGAGELKLLHRVVDGINVNGTRIHTPTDPGLISTFIPGVDLNCTKLGFGERGERYVQAITAIAAAAGRKDVLRVVDKMPGNYFWTGLIPFVLPNAKIVHTRRHPADTCLSNYRIFFPDGMPWSYDLRNLGKCYRAYHEHMQYWESNLPPGVLLSVRYEEVVADLERMARRIIDHIGLDWDEACLQFYKTERSVKTASLGQVRQPIYTTSVGRWRKYEKYLKPLIDEIGPLMQAYEDELEEASRLPASETVA